jgi:hypothetical protein
MAWMFSTAAFRSRCELRGGEGGDVVAVAVVAVAVDAAVAGGRDERRRRATSMLRSGVESGRDGETVSGSREHQAIVYQSVCLGRGEAAKRLIL